MQTQPESANVPTTIPTVPDGIHKNNPRLRTIHDARLRGALVTYANSTR